MIHFHGTQEFVQGSLGHWGKSVPCVLAPCSSIGHKELILSINEISTADGDVLTNYFQDEYIHTDGGADRLEGFGGYRVKAPPPVRDTGVIHDGRVVDHCLQGNFSPPGAMEAGLGCLCQGLTINGLLYGPGRSPAPLPSPLVPQPSPLQGLV